MAYTKIYADYNHVGVVGQLVNNANVKSTGVMWFYLKYVDKFYNSKTQKTDINSYNIFVGSRQLELSNDLTKGTKVLVEGKLRVIRPRQGEVRTGRDVIFIDADTITIIDGSNKKSGAWDNFNELMEQNDFPGEPAPQDGDPSDDENAPF